MEKLSRIQGCLLGGAAGDALGYTVEFLREKEIFRRYGPEGITAYDRKGGLARISDDTQMTLFTACGLLYGKANGKAYSAAINDAYLDWLVTQESWTESMVGPVRSAWIRNDKRLHSPRAPGGTCLDALQRGGNGTMEEPLNNSKGCGGVMRMAPIGLYLAGKCSVEEADRLGAEAAALTHGHELGYIPAAMLVHLIYRLTEGMELPEAVDDALESMKRQFAGAKHLDEFITLMEDAVAFARLPGDPLTAIHLLGQGWVAEEAMAIAVFCALRYPNDFDSAIIAAVSHEGDSDSTGAIAGNILGAYLGLAGIPEKYRKDLELSDMILDLAQDLSGTVEDELWRQKYVACTYGT